MAIVNLPIVGADLRTGEALSIMEALDRSAVLYPAEKNQFCLLSADSLITARGEGATTVGHLRPDALLTPDLKLPIDWTKLPPSGANAEDAAVALGVGNPSAFKVTKVVHGTSRLSLRNDLVSISLIKSLVSGFADVSIEDGFLQRRFVRAPTYLRCDGEMRHNDFDEAVAVGGKCPYSGCDGKIVPAG